MYSYILPRRSHYIWSHHPLIPLLPIAHKIHGVTLITSPGGNTPQSTNYTATNLPSRKLSKLDEPDLQDTAGEAGTSSEVMYSYGPPHMADQKQDDQFEHTYSSCVRIRDVALKTCQSRWTIGRRGERGSGISVLAAWHNDDDDVTEAFICHAKWMFLFNEVALSAAVVEYTVCTAAEG